SSVVGLDVSVRSLAIAESRHQKGGIAFFTFEQYAPSGNIDLAYCNGVFHHIPPGERDHAIRYVYDALRPGGLFALWENNPWNPATRYVMSRCEFDEDAILVTPRTARKLLTKNGFEVLRTDYRFIFPRSLRVFRKLEDLVFKTPLG